MEIRLRQLPILLLVMLLGVLGNAQNLLPNPSFETQTGCPTSPGVFTIVGNWRVVTSHTGSPDYFHVCGNSTFGVPTNVFGSQLARTGSAYIGFVTHFGSGNFREYLQTQTLSTLVSGTSYTATAYLSLSDGSGWATDGFGFYFSSTAVTGTGGSTPLPFTPQVSNPSGNYINTWTGWQMVSGSFVATPGLNYITIGNFKTDAATGVQVQASGWSWNYTYLDDISVTPTVILSADMGPLSGEVSPEKAAHLSWQTTSERGTLRYEVERSVGDLLHFERIGEVTAVGGDQITSDYAFVDPGFEPSRLNYYRLREVDQNGQGGYSQTLTLETADLENEIGIRAHPNPVAPGGTMYLEVESTLPQNGQLELVDLHGRQIYSAGITLSPGANPLAIEIGDLAPGWYVLRLQAGDVRTTHKVMVAR